jgi:hypothetical protein
VFVKADDVADTLRLLVPGFVALKVFYVLGLRTKRSDAQWAIWSVLATVPLAALAGVIHRQNDDTRLGWALGLAVLGGSLGSLLWAKLLSKWDYLRTRTAIRAWDDVLTDPCWIQIWTKDGKTLVGWNREIALSTETDDLDIYIDNPYVVDSTGAPVTLPNLKGILIARSEIHQIALFADDPAIADPGSG